MPRPKKTRKAVRSHIKPTEKDFQASVVKVARQTRWLVYHTYDSRRSEPGFPDLVLVRGNRLLFRELKVDARPSRVTADQRKWLDAPKAAGQDAGLWSPEDWNEILETLK